MSEALEEFLHGRDIGEWLHWVLHNSTCGLNVYDSDYRAAIQRRVATLFKPRILPAWKSRLREFSSRSKQS